MAKSESQLTSKQHAPRFMFGSVLTKLAGAPDCVKTLLQKVVVGYPLRGDCTFEEQSSTEKTNQNESKVKSNQEKNPRVSALTLVIRPFLPLFHG